MGDSSESTRYLALAFSPFPGTPPPLSGFLQSLQVRRLIHLGPGLLNVSRGMSHGCPLTVPTQKKLKLLDHFQKSSQNACLIGKPAIQGNKPPPHQVTFFLCPRTNRQVDESGNRIEVALISSSPLTHQLSSPMQRV